MTLVQWGTNGCELRSEEPHTTESGTVMKGIAPAWYCTFFRDCSDSSSSSLW